MNILIIDVETSFNVVALFGLRNVNVRADWITEPSQVMCFAAKWKGAKKTEFRSQFHDGKDVMLKRLWDLLDQADVVVHYYGSGFDIPRINQEFLLAGYGPPAPYQQIDVYKTIRRFKFPSNSLNYALKALGLTPKVKHYGDQLWRDCLAGDPKAWRIMRRYNIGDVTSLELLYERVLPWISGHPNLSLYGDIPSVACPYCNSGLLQKRGFSFKRSGKYQRYQCLECFGWSSDTRRADGTTIVPERA